MNIWTAVWTGTDCIHFRRGGDLTSIQTAQSHNAGLAAHPKQCCFSH